MNNITYLNRIKLSVVEHVSSLRDTINTPPQLLTNLRVPHTRSNLPPVAIIRYALLQPAWVVLQVVVLVRPVHQRPARPFIRHGVSKNDEADQSSYDEEHDEEVKPHENSVTVTSSGDAGQGDDHDRDSDDYERPLEELEAVSVVGSAAEPNPTAEDWDWDEEGGEVEESYQVVAGPHLVSEFGSFWMRKLESLGFGERWMWCLVYYKGLSSEWLYGE